MTRPEQDRSAERMFRASVAPEPWPAFGHTSSSAPATIDHQRILGVSRATALMIGIAVMHVVLAWIVRTPGFGWGEDDAAFFLLAKDLQTFNYRDVHDVLAPVHARFPPVFPAMLALVGKVTGNRLDVMLAFVGVCSAASIALLYDATRRSIGEDVAVLTAALVAINHTALSDAGNLMSEAPFRMFIALTLWGAARDPDSPRYAAVAVAGAVLAALTRSAGVVLLPALAGFWLLKRRYAWVFGLAVTSLVVVAWLWFTFSAPDATDRRLYVADIRESHDSVIDVLTRRLKNFIPRTRFYLTNLVPWTISVPTISGTVVDNVFWAGVTVIFGGIGLIAMLRHWTLAAFSLLAYAALMLIWRFAFERLVHPVVPLVLTTILAGCAFIVTRYQPRYRLWAVVALSALLGIGAVRQTGPLVMNRLACDRSAPADSEPCWPAPEREFLALAHWVRDSTPSDAVFFVSKERGFYIHANRKSINQDRALEEDSATVGNYLRSRGVSYTALTSVGVKARRHGELLRESCREFELVRQFTPGTVLFRLRPAPSPTDSTAACAAIRGFTNLPPS